MDVKKILKQLGSLSVLLFMLSGCVSDQISPEIIEVPETVSFSGDILPIFESSCNQAGCHGTNGIPPDLTAEAAWVSLIFFNYVDTVDTEASVLWTELSGGSMEEYATDQQRALILQWINQDAPNN